MGLGVKVKADGVGVGDVWDKAATLTLLQVLETAVERRPGEGRRADGAPMPEYKTEGYGDTKRVDLRRTGEMLDSIRIIRTSATGGIIECSLRHPRAVFMNRRFPFMGILDSDATQALAAAEAEHGRRLSERTKLKTRKGGNASALLAVKGLASEVPTDG